MGLWSASMTSWNASGKHNGMLPWNPSGPKGYIGPREGLFHNMKRGVLEMAGLDNTGQGMLSGNVRYGGGLLSSGGWREITHDVEKVSGGMYRQGAKRSLKGALGKFAGKAIGPAFFLYQASTEGIGAATKDSLVYGAAFGAARWGLGKIGMGLFNPLTLGAAALVGGVIGGRAALMAGQEYNTSVRAASFGSISSDTYGNAATLRQASLQAIQSSKLNGRNALGNEGSLMHL